MGLFDHVNFVTYCPKCGNLVKNFQSKSGPCLLDVVEPSAIFEFYSSCNRCHAFLVYTRVRTTQPRKSVAWTHEEVVEIGFERTIKEDT